MTSKQIEMARATLPSILDVKYQDWTKEQKTLAKELDCIEMINSCLVYGSDFWTAKSYSIEGGKICDSYVKELGIDRVKELYEEQKDYFNNHVIINYGVYTDTEGCSYNSINEPNLDLPTSVIF